MQAHYELIRQSVCELRDFCKRKREFWLEQSKGSHPGPALVRAGWWLQRLQHYEAALDDLEREYSGPIMPGDERG